MTGGSIDGNMSESTLAEGESSLAPPPAAPDATTSVASGRIRGSFHDENDERDVPRRPTLQTTVADDREGDPTVAMMAPEEGEATDAPLVFEHPKHSTTDSGSGSLPSPSLPFSPSRGGLASSEEESMAEMEDVNEEVSIAELSEGEGSCSSVETTARNDEEGPPSQPQNEFTSPLPDNVACVPGQPRPAVVPPPSSSTICSSSSTAPSGRHNAEQQTQPATALPASPVETSSSTNDGNNSNKKTTDFGENIRKTNSAKSSDDDSPKTATVKRTEVLSDDRGQAKGDSKTALPSTPPLGRAIKIPASSCTSGTSKDDKDPGLQENSRRCQQQQQHPYQRQQQNQQHQTRHCKEDHWPMSLPKFSNPENCMWTSTHAANSPSEDRSSSLVNVLLQPLPPNFDSETQLQPLEPDYRTLIRLSLWSVIDGHGGGSVATYASEVLLPHIAASISRALGCAIVDRGVCTVNGQLRDANALDLDGLIKASDRRSSGNPNSIHYRSPFERSDRSDDEKAVVMDRVDAVTTGNNRGAGPCSPPPASPPRRQSPPPTDEEDNNHSSDNNDSKASVPTISQRGSSSPHGASGSESSVKTSVKTATSPNHLEEVLLGTHSPREVAAITNAITESFLAVDEGWINSIDPVATHQTSCQSNGRWNSGACALVVFTVQRLDWTDVSGNEPGDRGRVQGGPAKGGRHDTSQNRDAARRRMLDFASRAKRASSLSTVSSTSSLTTEEAVHASGLESEITETEEEDYDGHSNSRADVRKRYPAGKAAETATPQESLISAPGGCSCHCYRAHDAMLYTAHVGDCRAVMLGSAPPRTIKVRDSFADHPDTTDDESSHHSSDETECLSSSDHDADSSDEEDIMEIDADSKNSRKQPATGAGTVSSSTNTTPSYMTYMRRPVRRSRRRSTDDYGANAPFIALPPLEKESISHSRMIEVDTRDLERRNRRKQQQIEQQQRSVRSNGERPASVADRCEENDNSKDESNNSANGGNGKDQSDSSTSSQESGEAMRLIRLPPVTRPIDLTTDHSAYNPAEVTAVLRRCNNAPRAISAGVGGGIKRVAGSLAVTRALGDAYLKTPLLSFLPYKSHAPYITARPEVNCRPLSSISDKVLMLATDGVWERASGEDVLRWVRNFYAERIAEAERRNARRSNKDSSPSDLPTSVILSPDNVDNRFSASAGNGGGYNSSNTALINGSLEAEQEQERQDDRSQNLDLQAPDQRRSRKRGLDTSMACSPSPASKRRKRGGRRGNAVQCGWSRNSNVADVIVRRVLNKVRRARNISSLHALMSLPQGRARRSKHDDITACVVDLSAFVS